MAKSKTSGTAKTAKTKAKTTKSVSKTTKAGTTATKKQTTKKTAKKPVATKPAAKKPAAKKTVKKAYPKIADRRLEQLRFTMEDIKVDALVITFLPNIRYLTNFSGSSATLFLMKDQIHFFTDDRYEEQIKDELYQLPDLHTHVTRDVWGTVNKKKILKNITTLGFEADTLAYSDAVDIRNKIRPVKFKPAPGEIERFTRPKAPEELANIKKACAMAEKVFDIMLGIIKPGITEKEIAMEIAHQGRMLGSEGDAFDIIAVSGPRSALVHGTPSTKKVKKNEIVLLDFGCIVNGFRSDITRTIAVGRATKEQKSVYQLLLDAKQAAVDTVRPGMNGKHVDAAARDMIKKAGYGDYFQHSLGHGLGLQTHEKPIITFRMDDQIVPEDTVLAIEPGVYLPGKFGMRVEDDIFVTLNGGKYITNTPKELVVI